MGTGCGTNGVGGLSDRAAPRRPRRTGIGGADRSGGRSRRRGLRSVSASGPSSGTTCGPGGFGRTSRGRGRGPGGSRRAGSASGRRGPRGMSTRGPDGGTTHGPGGLDRTSSGTGGGRRSRRSHRGHRTTRGPGGGTAHGPGGLDSPSSGRGRHGLSSGRGDSGSGSAGWSRRGRGGPDGDRGRGVPRDGGVASPGAHATGPAPSVEVVVGGVDAMEVVRGLHPAPGGQTQLLVQVDVPDDPLDAVRHDLGIPWHDDQTSRETTGRPSL